MTILPTLETRDLIGIDSYERAICYSANLLYSSFSIQNEDYSKDFNINLDNLKKEISIKVQFPVDYKTFWSSNGNFIIGAKSYSSSSIEYLGEYLPPSNGDFIIYPSDINTLERFFVYSIYKFKQYLTDNYPSFNDKCTYIFNERKRTIAIDVLIPFEPTIYETTLDLLLAVKNYKNVNISDEPTSNIFGNNHQLNNSSQLRN
ncbi:MAG: hypothetical protein GW856_02755 [Cyanobacteria bacterium]|nr:hypothetical protein [Cyanobacteria bacterium CG_2015-16_32_12]